MQCHQRRRARRVHADRRAFQPEGVGDPTRDHTGGTAGQQMAFHTFGCLIQPRPIPRRRRPGEHPRRGAAQRRWVDPGILQRLPARLQKQPLLRIHRQRFTRADPEKPRIKPRRFGQEPATGGVALARHTRLRVKQALYIPAPVRRELPDRVLPGSDQIPELRRGVRPAREPAAHPHNHHRVITSQCPHRHGHRPAPPAARRSARPLRSPASTAGVG